MSKQILVTGAAGFIGFYVCHRLLQLGHQVLGVDNLNGYYDVSLKKDRLFQLFQYSNFEFHKTDLSDKSTTAEIFSVFQPDIVIHLAAQAGVRYSLNNPNAYIDSNIVGLVNILEGCRNYNVKHLVYASSSSVYGANTKIPFTISDPVEHPISLYAATKRAGELMSYTYSHLFQIPTTGLRFFTVYGPWGRPDMAYFKFVQAIEQGKPIDVYNFGDMQRDFTYIDDAVEGIVRVMQKPPAPVQSKDETFSAPYKLYNIGNNQPVTLSRFIKVIEQTLGKVAQKNFLPMQLGDVPTTYANVDDLMQDVGFKPDTQIEKGIAQFVSWYRDYYK